MAERKPKAALYDPAVVIVNQAKQIKALERDRNEHAAGAAEAIDKLIETIETLGYSVVVWSERDEKERTRLLEANREAFNDLIKHASGDELLAVLKDMPAYDDEVKPAVFEAAKDEEIIEECGKREIALAIDADLMPVAQLAVRVAYAGMGEMLDAIGELRDEVQRIGAFSGPAGEMLFK